MNRTCTLHKEIRCFQILASFVICRNFSKDSYWCLNI